MRTDHATRDAADHGTDHVPIAAAEFDAKVGDHVDRGMLVIVRVLAAPAVRRRPGRGPSGISAGLVLVAALPGRIGKRRDARHEQTALRDRLPGTLIGISTGAWIERDDDRRLAMIGGWRELPDHASVNLKEPGAPAVIERLCRHGVGVEAGLASVGDAERLVQFGLGRLCLRALIEIEEQGLDEAMSVADGILGVLALAELRKPILLHGFDDTVWPFVERAVRDGLSVRVGLEDGSALPDGSVAPSNAELVRAAVQIAYGR